MGHFVIFVMNLGVACSIQVYACVEYCIVGCIRYMVRSLAGASPGYELLTHLKIITEEGEPIVYRG